MALEQKVMAMVIDQRIRAYNVPELLNGSAVVTHSQVSRMRSPSAYDVAWFLLFS